MATLGVRILVVDDMTDWREMISGLLEDAGYDVQTATSAEEALTLLKERPYHIAILDIRLEETEENNEDGLELAERMKTYMPELAVIMFTAFGTTNTVLRALQPHDDGKGTAFAYLQKHETSRLLELVERAFSTTVQANPKLTIAFSDGFNWAEVHQDIRCLKSLPLHRATDAITDLLQRIFYDRESIRISSLRGGQTDSGVLLVQPNVEGFGQTDVVVKFDERHRIEQEATNYKRYVEDYVGSARRTQQLATRANARLGGIAYTFIGARVTEFKRFDEVYHNSTTDIINQILANLFGETCRIWYLDTLKFNRPSTSLGADYQKWLGLRQSNLEDTLILLVSQENHSLSWHDPYRPLQSEIIVEGSSKLFPNPLILSQKAFPYSGKYCFSHGDLHEKNILVDTHNLTWLIDFYKTGPGHPIRDFAMMESVIKFYLAKPSGNLSKLLEWEMYLLDLASATNASEPSPSYELPDDLAKATAIIIHIRKLASQLVPSMSRQDYLISLYFHALKNTTLAPKLTLFQRQHALISASLIAQKLI